MRISSLKSCSCTSFEMNYSHNCLIKILKIDCLLSKSGKMRSVGAKDTYMISIHKFTMIALLELHELLG